MKPSLLPVLPVAPILGSCPPKGLVAFGQTSGRGWAYEKRVWVPFIGGYRVIQGYLRDIMGICNDIYIYTHTYIYTYIYIFIGFRV